MRSLQVKETSHFQEVDVFCGITIYRTMGTDYNKSDYMRNTWIDYILHNQFGGHYAYIPNRRSEK